jgi:hypothetical protein
MLSLTLGEVFAVEESASTPIIDSTMRDFLN